MSFIPLAASVNPNAFFFDSANRFNGVSALQQIRAQTLQNMEALRASRAADDLEFNSRLGARRAQGINEQNRAIRSQFSGISDQQLMQAGLLPGPDVQFNAAQFAAQNAPTIGTQNIGFGALASRTLTGQQIQANNLGLGTGQALLGQFAPQFAPQRQAAFPNPFAPNQALSYLTGPTTTQRSTTSANRPNQFTSTRPVQNVGTYSSQSARNLSNTGYGPSY